MEKKIQNIIFPADERFHLSWGLFYRGDRGNLDRERQILRIGQYQHNDFTTYLNGCSYGKWKKYTNMQGIKLKLEIEGSFRITLVGYHLDVYNPIRKEFVDIEYCLESRQIIEIKYPENDEKIIGFEITTLDSCSVYGGAYIGIYDDSDVRNVTLSLATTTCKKEPFIMANMRILKREILNSEDNEIRDNIYIHVVDNGRTLKPEEWNEPHLTVHPNNNVGGGRRLCQRDVGSDASEKCINTCVADG